MEETTKKYTALYWLLFFASIAAFIIVYKVGGGYCSMVLPFDICSILYNDASTLTAALVANVNYRVGNITRWNFQRDMYSGSFEEGNILSSFLLARYSVVQTSGQFGKYRISSG